MRGRPPTTPRAFERRGTVGLRRESLGSVSGKGTPLFFRGQGRPPFCLTRAVSPEKAPGRVGNFYPHSGPDSVFLVGNRGRYRVSGSKGAAPAYCHRADGRGACRPRLGGPVPSIELVLGGARRRTPTSARTPFRRRFSEPQCLLDPRSNHQRSLSTISANATWAKTRIPSGKAATKPDR